MNRLVAFVAAALVTACLAACGSGRAGHDGGDASITVFAAASLTETFTDLARRFEAGHGGVTVELNFAGSSDLVAQIQQGAPADVFASADEANMGKLTDAGLEGSEPAVFASNTLEIAVPPGNPAAVRGLADLTRSDINLVICAPEVPCGAATATVADAAGLTLAPVSEEQSVTDVLAKVEAGEADAGVVYVTDVRAAGDAVEGITFPESDQAVNLYPIATVAGSDHADLAREFVDLVLSSAGQDVLRAAGFAPAP